MALHRPLIFKLDPEFWYDESMKDREYQIEHLRTLSSLMDTRFKGPFGVKFGFDALIGLIPGVGDIVTSAISFYIIAFAASFGVSSATLVRMALNVLFENLIDMIPFFGNLYDFYWKANIKNMELLEEHINNPTRETIRSRTVVGLIFIALILVLIASGYVTFVVLRALWNLLMGHLG